MTFQFHCIFIRIRIFIDKIECSIRPYRRHVTGTNHPHALQHFLLIENNAEFLQKIATRLSYPPPFSAVGGYHRKRPPVHGHIESEAQNTIAVVTGCDKRKTKALQMVTQVTATEIVEMLRGKNKAARNKTGIQAIEVYRLNNDQGRRFADALDLL